MTPYEHTDFQRALTPGTPFYDSGFDHIVTEMIDLGELVLPTGSVVACDPSMISYLLDAMPFSSLDQPGSYSVKASIASMKRGDRTVKRVTCVEILLSDSTAFIWEPALLPDQDITKLRYGQFYGYSVDSGLGCFVDFQTLRYIQQNDPSWFLDKVLPLLDNYGSDVALNIPIDGSAGNMIIFSSGFGDGVYPSYWGLDAQNKRCCLVTDFEVLVSQITKELEFSLPKELPYTFEHPDLHMIGARIELTHADYARGAMHFTMTGTGASLCDIEIHIGDDTRYPSSTMSADAYRETIYTLDEPLPATTKILLHLALGIQSL